MFGEFTPLFSKTLMQKRLKEGRAVIRRDIGLEKRCPGCGEFWPQDTLFFCQNVSAPDGLDCLCKACIYERRNAKRAAKRQAA